MSIRPYYTSFYEWGGWYFWMPAEHCSYANADQLIGPYPTRSMCERQALCSHDANIGVDTYALRLAASEQP